jgi:hypothetical protein
MAETPQLPPTDAPHVGSYTRALLVSQDRRHLFVTPCQRQNKSLIVFTIYISLTKHTMPSQWTSQRRSCRQIFYKNFLLMKTESKISLCFYESFARNLRFFLFFEFLGRRVRLTWNFSGGENHETKLWRDAANVWNIQLLWWKLENKICKTGNLMFRVLQIKDLLLPTVIKIHI